MSFDLKTFLAEQIQAEIISVAFEQTRNALELGLKTPDLVSIQDENNLILGIKKGLSFIELIKINYDYSEYLGGYCEMLCYSASRIAKLSNYEFLIQAENWKIEGAKATLHIDQPALYYQLTAIEASKQLGNYIQNVFKQQVTVEIIAPETSEAIDDEALNSRIKDMVDASKAAMTIKSPEESKPAKKISSKPDDQRVIFKRLIKSQPTPLNTVLEEESFVSVVGEVFSIDSRVLSTGKTMLSFAISDHTNAIKCKLFLDKEEAQTIPPLIKSGSFYHVEGRVRYDTYEKDTLLMLLAINEADQPVQRKDTAPVKRIELHAHTTMSAMDSTLSAKQLVKRAISWGHPAVAITDHGVIQSFPEAMETAGKNIKIIYGVEGYLIDDKVEVISNPVDYPLNGAFVVFDIETTGFSAKYDGITEIGAVKVLNGQILERYSTFVNPEKIIPEVVVNLTGITQEMVANERTISEVLPEFLAFCGDAALVAHNAKFDMSFIREKAKASNLHFDPLVLDTLKLSRMLLKDLKRHRLNMVAKKLGIKLEGHHRAVNDAEATAQIFLKFVEMLGDENVINALDINPYGERNLDFKHFDSYHVIILVKDYVGLKHLYQMISHSHLKTFYRKPLIPKSLLTEKREGLIIGSACEAGEVYQGILNGLDDTELLDIASFYDYLEIQPIGNNQFLIEKGLVENQEELRQINRRILQMAKTMEVPCVATADVHFMDPKDEIYRRILMAGQGFSDAGEQPPLYFKTTDEMLEEFSYLGRELAEEVVIHATHRINDQIQSILPVPDGTYPPEIPGSDDELRTMCFEKARRIYGDPIPEIVEKRLSRELDSIIGNGYAVMYIIAQKLVTKSMEDGYLVGSRGSVGSSFAATMSDITEVNPLPPHYHCRTCLHSEFVTDGSIASGADLPDKNCPACGAAYKKDGHDIPFETFLGFEGDKEPDIDLNFAGVYQSTSHAYTEELFGEGYVYKAGTIGTVAEKTAFGFVKKYFEETQQKINYYEVIRLAAGCTGVKRTSGQHPGGIMVVPHYKDVHDFTPIQYPANDSTSGVITTHFDYHSISGRILKLDILGHDVPTIIKMLEDLTGENAMEIPLDDRETLKIFTSVSSLKIQDSTYPLKIGSLGIPEFGTRFVRQMLDETKPTSFAELVQISGLSHGTDVWINNAADLVNDGIVTLKEVIGTRDDIMVYLMYAGLPPKDAFFIMEGVRKGKGLKPEQEEQMASYKVPKWYIESCKKIKYMFPKAHAVAYVMMSVRIAYFKVHFPLAFYATFFSIKVDDFDAHLISQGANAIREQMKVIEAIPKMSTKEQNQYTVLEVAAEMYARGFECLPCSLYESDAEQFKISGTKLLPPFRALQGVGENAAKAIVESRHAGEFISINDLRTRSKANRSVVDALVVHGCMRGLPEDNQLSFDMFFN